MHPKEMTDQLQAALGMSVDELRGWGLELRWRYLTEEVQRRASVMVDHQPRSRIAASSQDTLGIPGGRGASPQLPPPPPVDVPDGYYEEGR